MKQYDMMEIHTLVKAIVRFFNDEEGATGIEYSLIAIVISVGILVPAALVGTAVRDLFNRVAGLFP